MEKIKIKIGSVIGKKHVTEIIEVESQPYVSYLEEPVVAKVEVIKHEEKIVDSKPIEKI